MIINISKISGFSCSDPVIDIRGQDGRGLYFFKNKHGRSITFNLIPGKWVTNNKLHQLEKPLIYKCPPLDKPAIKRELKPFKYIVESNPNKCTIDFTNPDYAIVTIDPEINETDIPFFIFVMFHEQGHFYWGGAIDKEGEDYEYFEKCCDRYAARNMLERGFNPSQCLFAIELCLSEQGIARKRKNDLYDWLKKVTVK